MPTLTPQARSDEVTWDATRDGLISGAMALVPSVGAVWLAMRNPRFVKATNWQSRTALVLMPTLFMFGFTSESKLVHRMHEVAQETEHSKATAAWAEKQHEQTKAASTKGISDSETEAALTELYRKSVEQSGVRIVPNLSVHHQIANYWQDNPFKILAAIGIPSVAYIFYGRSGQQHLQFQQKVMHTRVFGQFAVISMLLTLMGFKEYMDKNGKFITEDEADARVQEMQVARQDLLARLEYERILKEEQDEQIHRAHEEDVAEGHVMNHKKKKHHNVDEALI